MPHVSIFIETKPFYLVIVPKGKQEARKISENSCNVFFFTFSDYYAAKKSQAIEKIMELFPKQHISFFTNLNYSSSGEYLDSSIKTIDIC